mgnify:CR=1 FL=1
MPIPEWIEKWIDKLDEDNTAPVPVEPQGPGWGTPVPSDDIHVLWDRPDTTLDPSEE